MAFISTDHVYANDFVATDCQVINAVNKFRNHPSIIMIKNNGDDVLKK